MWFVRSHVKNDDEGRWTQDCALVQSKIFWLADRDLDRAATPREKDDVPVVGHACRIHVRSLNKKIQKSMTLISGFGIRDLRLALLRRLFVYQST